MSGNLIFVSRACLDSRMLSIETIIISDERSQCTHITRATITYTTCPRSKIFAGTRRSGKYIRSQTSST